MAGSISCMAHEKKTTMKLNLKVFFHLRFDFMQHRSINIFQSLDRMSTTDDSGLRFIEYSWSTMFCYGPPIFFNWWTRCLATKKNKLFEP